MKIHEIKICQEFDAPVEVVWEAFNDHINFGKMMGLAVERIVDSPDPKNINGSGSVRLIKIPLFSFEETIVKSERPTCIEYQISRGTPLSYHKGQMLFKSLPGNKSAIDYSINLGSNAPLLGRIIKTGLKNGIKGSLKKYAATLKK